MLQMVRERVPLGVRRVCGRSFALLAPIRAGSPAHCALWAITDVLPLQFPECFGSPDPFSASPPAHSAMGRREAASLQATERGAG